MMQEKCNANIYLLKLGGEEKDIASFTSYLSMAELQRYQQLVRLERQRQFVMGRMLLRFALSQLLNISFKALTFLEQFGQAPKLVFPDLASLGMSISHSGSWVACAVSVDTLLGIDIESINKERNILALAEHVFNDEELACLYDMKEPNRASYFYQLWCQKEAHYKLNGANNKSVFFKQFDHAELSISVCSNNALSHQTNIIELNSLLLPE